MQVLKSVGTGIHLCIIHRVLGSPIGTLTQLLVFFYVTEVSDKIHYNEHHEHFLSEQKILQEYTNCKDNLYNLWPSESCKISREAHCAVNKAVYVVYQEKYTSDN